MYYAIIVFLVLLFLGMPVAFSIGISGLCFFLIRELPLTVLIRGPEFKITFDIVNKIWRG